MKQLTQQPAIRLDYQLSSKLRFTGSTPAQRARRLTTPGLIQGFTDVFNPYPFITNYAFTANYMINPTTFIEGTYGFIRNELAGGNEGGILINDAANRLKTSACDFPLLYPDAGEVDPRVLRLRSAGRRQARRSGTAAARSTCRRSSAGAAASAPRRRTSGIPAG